MKTSHLASSVLLLVVISSTSAIFEEKLKESSCDKIDQKVDMKWLNSVKKWYIPIWTKIYQARVASDLLEKAVGDISCTDPGKTCLTFLDSTWVTGLGQRRNFGVTGDDTSFNWKADWGGAKAAKFSFKLTDNKSFLLGITCWEDNTSGWALLSNETKLDKKVRERVVNFVKALGFHEEFIVNEDYSGCDMKSEL